MEQVVKTTDEIKKSFGKIIVDNVTKHTYKDGVFQAQLRQDVTVTYPSLRVTNSKSDLLFGLDKFKLPEGQQFKSTRVTWIPLPSEMKVEEVQAAVDAVPTARIYKTISNKLEDVLTKEQMQAIEKGIRSVEEFKNSRLVRDKDGKELKGTPQYSQNFFSLTAKEDEDFRTVKTVEVENGQALSLVAQAQPAN